MSGSGPVWQWKNEAEFFIQPLLTLFLSVFHCILPRNSNKGHESRSDLRGRGDRVQSMTMGHEKMLTGHEKGSFLGCAGDWSPVGIKSLTVCCSLFAGWLACLRALGEGQPRTSLSPYIKARISHSVFCFFLFSSSTPSSFSFSLPTPHSFHVHHTHSLFLSSLITLLHSSHSYPHPTSL